MGSKIEKILGFFLTKLARLRRHSFENRQRQSEILFCFTNKYRMQDREPLFKDRYDMEERKCYLLTHLLSLLENLEILFLKQNNPFEETQF